MFPKWSNIPGVRREKRACSAGTPDERAKPEGAAPPFAGPEGNEKGRRFPPAPEIRVAKDQTFSAGMICFLRDMMPGRTTVSPVTVQPNEASAIFFTRSFGTSSVASSFRMSMTKSST